MANTEDVKIKVGVDGQALFDFAKKGAASLLSLATQGNVIKAALGGAFTYAINDIRKAIDEVQQLNSELVKLSRRTGAPVESLQVWGKQIKKLGGDVNDVAMMLNKLELSQERALTEGSNSKISKSFSSLGVSHQDLISKSSSELFEQIQKTMSSVGTTASSLVPLTEIFGKNMTKYSHMLLQNIEKTKEHLKEMGGFHWIDEKTSKQLDILKRQSSELNLMNIGDTPGGRAKVSAAEQAAWVEFKAIATLVGGSIADLVTGNSPKHSWRRYVDMNAERNPVIPLVESTRTPEQVAEARMRRDMDKTLRSNIPLGDLGTNPLLKMGNLMGIDVSYRIERNLESIEKNTREIANNTKPQSPVTPPTQPALPAAEGPSQFTFRGWRNPL
jgi:hypothetical protein